eukprot:COSAG01_NODE_903_length_12848_cov_7.966899_4_plen_305_part_00
MAAALPQQSVARFHRDGYLRLPSVLSGSEADRVRQIVMRDPKCRPKGNSNFIEATTTPSVAASLVGRAAADGGQEDPLPEPPKTMLSHTSFSPHDEACSAWGCSRRVIAPLEALLGGTARHYYSILMAKTPHTGGWEYHQDYGYHYAQFLRPEGYISMMLALSPCTRANGCLRVYRGSHKLGRLDHRPHGSQRIADPERVELAVRLGQLEEVHCELDPGDALFFHGNTLHASDANTSETSRWTVVYSYAAEANPVVVQPDPTQPLPLRGGLRDAAVEAAVAAHEASLQLEERGDNRAATAVPRL